MTVRCRSATGVAPTNDRRFFGRVARDGALGLGTAYVNGLWDSPAVDEMITRRLELGRDIGQRR